MDLDPAVVWFLRGLALVLLEVAVPGVILVFFGGGAWIVALTTWAGLTSAAASKILLFAIASVGLLVGLRKWVTGKFSGYVSDVQDPSTNLDEFTGKPVEVLQDVVPGRSGGKVEFKGASWSARAEEPIARGEPATIERIDGITLVIKRVAEEES